MRPGTRDIFGGKRTGLTHLAGYPRDSRGSPGARAHALSLGTSASIAVVVSLSRKPPDWCCHSLA